MSIRVLLWITSIFGILIFATYEADLTTRMTVQESATPLRSFSEIAESPDHNMFTYTGIGGFYYNLLKAAKPGTGLSKVYSQVASNPEKWTTRADCDNACRNQRMIVRIISS